MVDLRKIDRDDMHVDSLDEKYHACLEDISCPTLNEENNLTLNEEDNLVEELLEHSSMDLNDMASGESLVTSPQLFEAATLQEIHNFGAQAQRKKKPNSHQVVAFSAGRSKRIQAPRVWHVDGDVSNPSQTYRGYARIQRVQKDCK